MTRRRVAAPDAAFLAEEGGRSRVVPETGSAWVFDRPAPSREELVERLSERLHLLHNFDRRIVPSRFPGARPLWAPCPNFELERHVSELEASGDDEAALRRSLAPIFSTRLERDRPLWRMWLLSGLADGRWALIFKHHHAMADGVSLMYILSLLDDRFAPTDQLEQGDPAHAAAAFTSIRSRARIVAAMLLRPAPRIEALNGDLSGRREVRWTTIELASVKRAGERLGGTLNELYLAALAGALDGYLRHDSRIRSPAELRALIAASYRRPSERGALGNRFALVPVRLPNGTREPAARVRAIRAQMDVLRSRGEVPGHWRIGRTESLLPFAGLRAVVRLASWTRGFNIYVSNLAGPVEPVTLFGARMLYPVTVTYLARRHGLSACLTTTADVATVSFVTDPAVIDDPDRLPSAFEDAATELRRAAWAA